MSSYIKISYKTKDTNESLKQCIMYIGKYFGKNNFDTYKAGKAFLAKKVKGASKTSVDKMVYPKNISNNGEYKQWCFKKHAYERTYAYIIYTMMKCREHRLEALNLLNSLYVDISGTYGSIEKTLSNILVSEQKDLLQFAVDKPVYEGYQDDIVKILNGYKRRDNIYRHYLK